MLVFVVGVVVVMLPILLALLAGTVLVRLDSAVIQTKVGLENKDKGYNPNMTFGHKIKVQANTETQLKEARLLAAKQAAATPRGANMRIGRAGQVDLKTAGKALAEDPLTAVKIATYHGWDGARTGAPAGGVPVAAPTPVTRTVTAPAAKPALAPGKDYTVIPITDNMSPEEKRRAIIANAKAKSAAQKAAKAVGEPGVVETVVTAEAPVAAPVAQPTMVAASIPEPEYIDITPDMSPEEVRKARIENSKRKSAYQKALKASGVTVAEVAEAPVAQAAVATPVATPAPAPAVVPSGDSAALAGIPKPDYVEITPDMSPEQVRQARVANSKARSAYIKALKAAGIDPATVGEG